MIIIIRDLNSKLDLKDADKPLACSDIEMDSAISSILGFETSSSDPDIPPIPEESSWSDQTPALLQTPSQPVQTPALPQTPSQPVPAPVNPVISIRTPTDINKAPTEPRKFSLLSIKTPSEINQQTLALRSPSSSFKISIKKPSSINQDLIEKMSSPSIVNQEPVHKTSQVPSDIDQQSSKQISPNTDPSSNDSESCISKLREGPTSLDPEKEKEVPASLDPESRIFEVEEQG